MDKYDVGFDSYVKWVKKWTWNFVSALMCVIIAQIIGSVIFYHIFIDLFPHGSYRKNYLNLGITMSYHSCDLSELDIFHL